MATAIQSLTRAQFDQQYRNTDDRFEYWYGEARERGTPTVTHGLLQGIMVRLFTEAGLLSGSEIELRIDLAAHPKPDVIASSQPFADPYPVRGFEIAVEVLSGNDSHSYLKEKCRSYKAWGIAAIYVIDPSDRSVSIWTDGRLEPVERVQPGIEVRLIWEELDRLLSLAAALKPGG